MAAKYFSNQGKVCLCAADTFMFGISMINMNGNIITGICRGKQFTLTGVSSFEWGTKKHHNRHKTPKVDFYYDGTGSSISLESLWIFLKEAYDNNCMRDTYKGLAGNCMGNEVAQNMPCNFNWIEIVTHRQNSSHGSIWNTCFDEAGIRMVFTATNTKFKEYIMACRDEVDEGYINKYSGSIVKVNYAGTEYWVVD